MSQVDPLIGADSAVASGRWWQQHVDVLVLNGRRLEHFRRLTDRPDRPWQLVATVSEQAVGPGELMAGSRLRARVVEAGGEVVLRYDEHQWVADPDQRWNAHDKGEQPRPDALGVPAERVRAIAVAGGRWPQAVVDVDGSVYGYQRRADGRWQRSSCLRVSAEPVQPAENSSVKVAQVTGERDATVTPWGERPATLSRSWSSAGIRGTDLGVRVDYAGRSFLLFGDTHWSRPWLALRDSIAEVIDDGDLPQVRFHGSPLRVRGGGVTRGEYDVPLDAFGYGGHFYALFSSNHGRGRQVMGRSVLARCTTPDPVIDPQVRHRPIVFDTLSSLSDWHFINASVQLRPAAEVPGAGGDGDVLLIWGTCLLYTSPSPRDRTRSRMPSSA
jgi:hypothetical protein